jgi:hypothetical protein
MRSHAGMVFDYAIFVQCVTPARLHDYFNGLLHMQILFAWKFKSANKKSLHRFRAGYSWLCCVKVGRISSAMC